MDNIDVNKRNGNGYTSFYVAVQDRLIDEVKQLLRDDRIDPNKENNKMETPFHVACQLDKNDIMIKLLLADERIDPNTERQESG